jgi:soluble lytic murein transglycosylase-like protein
MKFTVIALALGSAVFLCPFPSESKFLAAKLPVVARFSQAVSSPVRHFFGFAPPSATGPLDGPVAETTAPPVPQLSKEETLALIADAAARYQVPKVFVTSIVAAESNFDCMALSDKGAIGLMQLMPETAQQFSADPKVPAQNIDAGTRYLRWLIDRYRKSSGSLQRTIAAYNAGPGNVDRYRGVPPFPETRNYVTRVMGFMKQFSPPKKTAPVARGKRRPVRDEWQELLASAESPRTTITD